MTTNTQSYPMASLYVGDLHHEATEAMLYEKFSQVTSMFFDDNSFLEQFRIEHTYKKASSDSKLRISSVCSTRAHSRS